MISVYKNANKEKKQYKVKFVKVGKTKNGGDYTTFKINDNKQDPTTKVWKSISYGVFVWEALKIQDDDMIEFNEIQSIEIAETEVNGEKKAKGTIFASVKVISTHTEPTLTEMTNADDPFANIGVQETISDDDLPF